MGKTQVLREPSIFVNVIFLSAGFYGGFKYNGLATEIIETTYYGWKDNSTGYVLNINVFL